MEKSKVSWPVERHFQVGTSGVPKLISRHCRVVLMTSSPKAGRVIALRWAVLRRGSRIPLSLAWTSNMADASMVSPPTTVWEKADPAARARKLAVSTVVRTKVLIVVKNSIARWFLVRGCTKPSAQGEIILFPYRKSFSSIYVTFMAQSYPRLPKPDETVLRVLHTSFFRGIFILKP